MSAGADLVAAALRDHGVDIVFGVPGSQNVTLFEALNRHDIRTVLASSETAAGFLALGWHRASGRLGVYSVVSGPGFAFAIPPLAEAAHDSSGLLLIAGLGPGKNRKFDLQDIDQATIASALCGTAAVARSPDDVGAAIADALSATTRHGARPGVLLHTRLALEGRVGEETAISAAEAPRTATLPGSLGRAVADSRRPLIIVGAEAVDSAAEIERIARMLGALVTTTPSARGVLPESDSRLIAADLLCDDVDELNGLVERSDLVLAPGCRFSHNSTGGFRLSIAADKLAHIHPDASVLDANYSARWPICGTSASFLAALGNFVGDRSRQPGWSDEEVRKYRQRIIRREATTTAEPDWPDVGIKGCRQLVSAIRGALPDDAILVTDTGNHQIFVRKYFEVRKPRGLICPVDFQSMGFGIPAAIGASLASEGRPVAGVVGDGGFLMTSAELAILARLRAPTTIIVLCDGYLGQIREKQVECGLREEMTTLQMPDLGLLARSHGIHYERANHRFQEQLSDCVASGRPALIEVRARDSSAQKRRKAWRRTLGNVSRRLNDGG